MSGHSKWNNIRRKKEKTDSQRARIFTKIGREMSVAVRQGGADPSINGKLKELIAKAKSYNVPNDNIERIIKKAGDSDRDNFEAITYEGYGPSGVAVIVETLTDNRNRTAGDLRHYFDKYGGNLGQTGCVSFMFSRKGVVILEGEFDDEEKVMEDIIECGGADFDFRDGGAEVFTDTAELQAIASALAEKGYSIYSAEEEMIPSNYVSLSDGSDAAPKMDKMLEMLDAHDDVINVWHNISE